MPPTDSLRQKINELTATPAAKKVRRKKKPVEPAPRSDKDWTDAEKRAVAQAQAAGLGLYDIVVKIDPHCTMPIAARQLLQNAISGIGQVLVVRPDVKSAAASRQVEFIFASLQTKEQIAAKCQIPTITGDVHVTVIQAPTAAKASSNVAEQIARKPQAATAASTTPETAAATPAQPAPTVAQASGPELPLPQGLTRDASTASST